MDQVAPGTPRLKEGRRPGHQLLHRGIKKRIYSSNTLISTKKSFRVVPVAENGQYFLLSGTICQILTHLPSEISKLGTMIPKEASDDLIINNKLNLSTTKSVKGIMYRNPFNLWFLHLLSQIRRKCTCFQNK